MPYNHMDEFIDILFNVDKESDLDCKKVRKAAIFIWNDSFYTVANLTYDPKEVALAAILQGAEIIDVLYPGKKYYDMDKFRERAAKSGKAVQELNKYWFKNLDPSIDIKSVNEIICMIYQFYEKIKEDSKLTN